MDWSVEPGDYIGYTWYDSGVLPFIRSAISNYWTGRQIIPIENSVYTFGIDFIYRMYSLRATYTVYSKYKDEKHVK